MAEPSVVQDQHLDVHLRAHLRDVQNLLRVEIEIRRLPVVHENRAAFAVPRAADQMRAHEIVQIARHLAEAFAGPRHEHLRRLETLARVQLPAEQARMDADLHTDAVELVDFRRLEMVAAVFQDERERLAHGLRRTRFAKNQRGRMDMARRAAQTARRLDAMPQRRAFQIAFTAPAAVEVHHFIMALAAEIHLCAHGAFETDDFVGYVLDNHGTRNDVVVGEHAVQHRHFHAADFVLQRDFQIRHIRVLRSDERAGQAVQRALFLCNFIGNEPCVRPCGAVFRLEGQRGHAHVAAVKA